MLNTHRVKLENVEHCRGEPEQADIMSLMSDVTHQVKHPPTCTIHSPFTGGLKRVKMCANKDMLRIYRQW